MQESSIQFPGGKSQGALGGYWKEATVTQRRGHFTAAAGLREEDHLLQIFSWLDLGLSSKPDR